MILCNLTMFRREANPKCRVSKYFGRRQMRYFVTQCLSVFWSMGRTPRFALSVWLSIKTIIEVVRRVREAGLLLLIRFVVGMWCLYWRFLTSGLRTAHGACAFLCLSTDQTFPTHQLLLVIYNIICTSVCLLFYLIVLKLNYS